jgi:beta-1,4-mannosyltransferase
MPHVDRPASSPLRATVVVLGDVARSPRTLYHALALARAGVEVELVGFADTPIRPPGPAGRLTVRALTQAPRQSDRGWRWLVTASQRGIGLIWGLVRALVMQGPAPDVILVQNPPGVPVLFVAWLAARLRSARYVIDWHNFTSSMIALRVGPSHVLVRLVSRYEQMFGRHADGNLFVSAAMRERLAGREGIRGTVFRDRPASRFVPLAREQRALVRRRVLDDAGMAWPADDFGLVVSPTSWTADEDFDLLFDGLDTFERVHGGRDPGAGRVPPLLVLLTGRGARRERYRSRMAQYRSSRLRVHAMWLEAEDYPHVLAAADLGLCLHRSASGVDLPMKIADLFGAGVPVLAIDYGPCLAELVAEGANGRLFRDAAGLARSLEEVFDGFSSFDGVLARLRAGVEAMHHETWEEAWEREAAPVLLPALDRSR